MELSDQFVKALAELEPDCGSVITWHGNDYPVMPGSAVRGKDLGAGGFKLRSDLKLIVRLAVFPDPGPQLKQTITYLGDAYRIDTMEKMPGDGFWRWELNDPTQ